MEYNFIECEKVLIENLNISVKGRNAKEQRLKVNSLLNDYLAYGGVTYNKLLSFISGNNRDIKTRKLKRILANNSKVTIGETLQEDKPIKEDYPQRIDIKEYGLNKWGEPILKNVRCEWVIKSRCRFPKRFLKVINLI